MAGDTLGFEPLANSVKIDSRPEDSPFLLAPGFRQELIASVQSAAGLPVVTAEASTAFLPILGDTEGHSDFDMLTLNETGPEQGRYLFRSHELRGNCSDFFGGACFGGNSGVSRTDLETGETVTIVQRPDFDNFGGLKWTPWGTVLVAEQILSGDNPLPFSPIPDPDFPRAANGLVYEITNPLANPADVVILARPALGSMAHEGIQIDNHGHVYLVDEFPNSGGHDLGAIYKFVPSEPANLAQGQLFALTDVSADDGEQLGLGRWVPLNDSSGNSIAGVDDPRIDAHAAANAVGATDYNRPEDLEIGGLANGNQVLYAAITSDHLVLSIELSELPVVREFVTDDTIDLASGLAVGTEFSWPDNLAMDSAGRIYIVEDDTPGDIWTAVDTDHDGVAEAVGRWASLSTVGAEPSGLYFSPFDSSIAFVNVMHPDNRPPDDAPGDATFLISSRPVPGDANGDGRFDSFDLIQTLQAGKYGSQLPATRAEGDFNDDGVFDRFDIVFALQNGAYVVISDLDEVFFSHNRR